MIPFNNPYYNDYCIENIKLTYNYGIQSGDGEFSKKCEKFFQEKYNFFKKNIILKKLYYYHLVLMH